MTGVVYNNTSYTNIRKENGSPADFLRKPGDVQGDGSPADFLRKPGDVQGDGSPADSHPRTGERVAGKSGVDDKRHPE